jgi:hypothetical protein
MQTWATFSIVDHRKPIYRQALALFDRIVVPLPEKPIGDQTQDELDQLAAEIAYLEKNGAAKPYEWKSPEFDDWRTKRLAEVLAADFIRDALLDTRLMLAEQFACDDVQAIPVYGGEQHFADARKDLMQVEEALTVEIVQKLPIPDYETPLENIVSLRTKPAFRKALEDLRNGSAIRLPQLSLQAIGQQPLQQQCEISTG